MHFEYKIHDNIKRKCFIHEPGYIYVTDFTEESLEIFQHEFNTLQKSKQNIIPVVIDSYGGDVYALFGMVSLMKSSKVPVATIIPSKAFSCGAVLASAGTPGKRFIAPYGSILVHQISLGEEGKMSEVQSSLDHAEKLNKTLLSMLDENCGKEPGFFAKHIKELANVDFYLKPKEAKKVGIIDHVGLPEFIVEVEQRITIK